MTGQSFNERFSPPIVLIECLESILREHFNHILIRPLNICYDIDLAIFPLLGINIDIALEPRQLGQAAGAEVRHPGRLSSVKLIRTWVYFLRA